MSIYEGIFIGLDIFVFAVIFKLIQRSQSVRVKIRVNDEWITQAFFFVIAVIVFFRYKGIFRLIEVPVLIVMGILFSKVGYGLSDEGIVVAGRLIKYEEAGELELDRKENRLTYLKGMSPAALTFTPDQYDEIEKYLKSLNQLK